MPHSPLSQRVSPHRWGAGHSIAQTADICQGVSGELFRTGSGAFFSLLYTVEGAKSQGPALRGVFWSLSAWFLGDSQARTKLGRRKLGQTPRQGRRSSPVASGARRRQDSAAKAPGGQSVHGDAVPGADWGARRRPDPCAPKGGSGLSAPGGTRGQEAQVCLGQCG